MSKDTNADNLRAELKSLADTLEEVLNSSSDKSKEEISKLRSKAESALKERPNRPAKPRRVPTVMCVRTRGRAWVLGLRSVWYWACC